MKKQCNEKSLREDAAYIKMETLGLRPVDRQHQSDRVDIHCLHDLAARYLVEGTGGTWTWGGTHAELANLTEEHSRETLNTWEREAEEQIEEGYPEWERTRTADELAEERDADNREAVEQAMHNHVQRRCNAQLDKLLQDERSGSTTPTTMQIDPPEYLLQDPYEKDDCITCSLVVLSGDEDLYVIDIETPPEACTIRSWNEVARAVSEHLLNNRIVDPEAIDLTDCLEEALTEANQGKDTALADYTIKHENALKYAHLA